MGRRCGDLAMNAGIADGAEMIITSEIGFDESKVIERLKASKESDKKHAIVVITEHITDVHELAKKVEAATIVFKAVSKPTVKSVSGISLSIVPGIPIQLTPISVSFKAPL